jgi:hypothetical protein
MSRQLGIIFLEVGKDVSQDACLADILNCFFHENVKYLLGVELLIE